MEMVLGLRNHAGPMSWSDQPRRRSGSCDNVPVGVPVQIATGCVEQAATGIPVHIATGRVVQTGDAEQPAYRLPFQYRKRDIRQFARYCSMCASLMILVNAVALHVATSPVWIATVFFISSAVINLVAAFAEDGSFCSFMAAVVDLGLALGSGICLILQVYALKVDSHAVYCGMHLVAAFLEIGVVGLNVGASMLGVMSDEVLTETEKLF